MLELGIKALLAYWLGSISGSLLVGRVYGGVDIRDEGSGNAGGTNAFRTQGWLFALCVIIIDVGKGVLAATIIPSLPLPPPDPEVSRVWLAAMCGGASVIGHIWPCWYQFRGGKGAGTLIGVCAAVAPKLLLAILLVWVLTLVLSGFVGLATMLAASGAALAALLFYPGRFDLWVFFLAMAVLIVFTHRSNIMRMLAGNENQMRKAMLLRAKR